MQTKIVNVLLFLIIGISLVACGVSETELIEQATTFAGSIFATQTAQTLSSPPTSTIPPATTQDCPITTVGTLILKNFESIGETEYRNKRCFC